MNSYIVVLLFITLLIDNQFISEYQNNKVYSKEFPSGMKKNNQSLFYIERSKNKNRVYYDANFNVNGALNTTQPIDVYWLNLEENYGKRGELSFIQEKMAYGYKSVKLNERLFEIKLKAFGKRPLLLLIDNKGQAKIQMKILGKSGKLHHIYIKASNKGMATSVEYIEIYGTEIFTKAEIYEKIIP